MGEKTRAFDMVILPDSVEFLDHTIERPDYILPTEWLKMWHRFDNTDNRLG